jgi:predicted NUDIX family NTP pyrophosphohydrolase
MKTRHSAGLLIYRLHDSCVQVLLVHPGGPFWINKDIAAWSIPKGEYEMGEDPLAAAKREFVEETGQAVPSGSPVPLSPVKQAGGKTVHAWYLQGEVDVAAVRSNTFTLEWPPKSGAMREFPEVDKAAWFNLADARSKIHKGQVGIIDELEQALNTGREL